MSEFSHWRTIAAETIKETVDANQGVSDEELRRIVSRAYPFGEREMHPYKIWLSEVQKWFGKTRGGPAKSKDALFIDRYREMMARQNKTKGDDTENGSQGES